MKKILSGLLGGASPIQNNNGIAQTAQHQFNGLQVQISQAQAAYISGISSVLYGKKKTDEEIAANLSDNAIQTEYLKRFHL